jgi:hypothetical protein
LRIEYAGALYHVISRGSERKPIVCDDADREKRLDWLWRTVEICGWRLHAFVLVRNHEDLFVEMPGGKTRPLIPLTRNGALAHTHAAVSRPSRQEISLQRSRLKTMIPSGSYMTREGREAERIARSAGGRLHQGRRGMKILISELRGTIASFP